MKIFIGSAKESLTTAKTIKYILEKLGHKTTIWNETGVFIPSTYTIQNLERLTTNFDAAVFVCSEDDMTFSNGNTTPIIRDNVIFEAGLFVGKLGHEKVALYVKGRPKIPSDLTGLTVIIALDNLAEDEKEFRVWLQNVSENNKQEYNKILMLPRHRIDNRSTIEDRWQYAKEIMFVNFASTAFIAAPKVAPEHVAQGSLRELYQNKIIGGCNFKFLINEPSSYADFDASYSKMNIITNNGVEISDIIQMAYDGLEDELVNLKNYGSDRGALEYRTTNIVLPYGLVLVTNDAEHSQLNHIKVDLYSPYLSNDRERRSFILYPDDENYQFFYKQITTLWNKSKKRQVKPKITSKKIPKNEIELALKKMYRQYFVGDLQREQHLEYVYDSKIEIGMSAYTEFTADQPHFHKYATEYLYVLQGEYRLSIKGSNALKYERLKAGDFYIIPKHTTYASKADKDTVVLFIKSPGLNDKENCSRALFDNFLDSWD